MYLVESRVGALSRRGKLPVRCPTYANTNLLKPANYLAQPCTVFSAAPQPGVAFMHLQVGDDRTLRCYCHHDLGVSLHLDTMRLSQAWRCAPAVAGWTVPGCVLCALFAYLF